MNFIYLKSLIFDCLSRGAYMVRKIDSALHSSKFCTESLIRLAP